MSRRSSPIVQVLIVVLVVCLFLYGFYCYHDQHTRLKRSEETVDKLKQKAESLSAQLQVLYEHKTRLETTVQQEKELHKKTKEGMEIELKTMENKYSQEKTQRVDLMSELESLKIKADEKTSALDKLQQECKQWKQECDNDAARLHDDIADVKRHLQECQNGHIAEQPLRVDVSSEQQRPADIAQLEATKVNHTVLQQPVQNLVEQQQQQQQQQQSLHINNDIKQHPSDTLQPVAFNNHQAQELPEKNAHGMKPHNTADDEYDNDVEKSQHQINRVVATEVDTRNVQVVNKDGAGL